MLGVQEWRTACHPKRGPRRGGAVEKANCSQVETKETHTWNGSPCKQRGLPASPSLEGARRPLFGRARGAAKVGVERQCVVGRAGYGGRRGSRPLLERGPTGVAAGPRGLGCVSGRREASRPLHLPHPRGPGAQGAWGVPGSQVTSSSSGRMELSV